ncbi:hypothetical protein RQP46_006635 [Phenoliferia psychrophenolica]
MSTPSQAASSRAPSPVASTSTASEEEEVLTKLGATGGGRPSTDLAAKHALGLPSRVAAAGLIVGSDADDGSVLSSRPSSTAGDFDEQDDYDSDDEMNELLEASLSLIERHLRGEHPKQPRIRGPSKPWTAAEDAHLWSLLERRRAGESLKNAVICAAFGGRTTSAVGQRISHLNRIKKKWPAEAGDMPAFAIAAASVASGSGAPIAFQAAGSASPAPGVPASSADLSDDTVTADEPAPAPPAPKVKAAPKPRVKKDKVPVVKAVPVPAPRPSSPASSLSSLSDDDEPAPKGKLAPLFTLAEDTDDAPVASTSTAPAPKAKATKATKAPKEKKEKAPTAKEKKAAAAAAAAAASATVAPTAAFPFGAPVASTTAGPAGKPKPKSMISAYFKPIPSVQGPTPPESDREDAPWTTDEDKELMFQGMCMFKDGIPEDKTHEKWAWLAFQCKRQNGHECRKRFLELTAEREAELELAPVPVASTSGTTTPKKAKGDVAASRSSSRPVSTSKPTEAAKSKKRPSSAGLDGAAAAKKSKA